MELPFETPTEPVYISSPDEIQAEMAAIQAEIDRRHYLEAPDDWVQRVLREELWSGQRTILRAIAQHRKVAVKSCHEIGKSFTAARVVGWWLANHPLGEAFVVTTAPTNPQVRAILWREIGRMHAAGNLPGRLNQTEWLFQTPAGRDELIAFGRKPDDFDPTAFQGIHARYVLVVGDEACGIAGPIWEAADSLIANNNSKMLVIGNPDDPTTHFEEICRPGSGWHVVSISAFDSPNLTGESMSQAVLDQLIGHYYIEEKRRKWAPSWYWVDKNGEPCEMGSGVRVVPPPGQKLEDTNPLWQSKICGEFPPISDSGSLIPGPWIRAAQQRELEPQGESVLGVDVGGGGDSSTGCHRHGNVFRVLWEDKNPDTMQTCGKAVAMRRKVGASRVHVDSIGIGRGVVDRAVELGEPFEAINVGESPSEDNSDDFVNWRAELWWSVRERFESGDIDIDLRDDDLAGELSSLRYKRTSSGKIQIESKDEAKRRGVPSPNRADSLMLSAAQPKMVNAPKGGSWR